MLFDDDNLHGEKSEHLILFTKFGCDVNIKFLQEEELFKIWVASFIMRCFKPKVDVKMSIFDPSISVLSLLYQEFDFALKSPRTTIKSLVYHI